MDSLPIEKIRDGFLKALKKGPVVVEAPPGSGKSTRIPLWCAEKGRVLVVEPRRMACRSLAGFTAASADAPLGEYVGYVTRFDCKSTEKTRVIFATPGIALHWYCQDALAGFAAVMLDEFHERRWDVDLLAALLRSKDTNLVLASATVEGGKLAGYLQGTRLLAGGKQYAVNISYTEKDTLPGTRDLDSRVARAALKALEQAGGGDVLVFLPGKKEIRDCRARLEKNRAGAEILPLHASVDTQIQDMAMQPGSRPRIILSTNVAETSLTLPGVRAVVDSGLERRTHYRNGRTVLALCPVSQAAADQRAGRAGRLGPGQCIRLWGRAARLEPYTPPEVVREDPSEFVLAAAACGHRVQDLVCPDPLPEHSLERALNRLQGLGALNGEGGITRHGRRLFHLPLDAQLAHLIASASSQDSREDLVDLAAALSARGSILWGNQSEKGRAELAEFAPEACDLCTLIRLMRSDPPGPVNIKPGVLAEARGIASRVREALEMDAPPDKRSPDRDRVVRDIMQADPELVFVRRARRRQCLGNGGEEVETGSATRMPDKDEAALVLDRHSIPGRGTTKTISIATCLAPVSFPEMERAGLGEVIREDPVLEDMVVRVKARRVYAGRVIASHSEEPRGKELCTAVAELIMSSKLWPHLGRYIQEEAEAWNLYLQLGLDSGEPVNPREWLAKRLEEIGLEESRDLEVLQPEDFDFQGVPEEKRREFDKDHPRSLTLANMKLEVRYEPRDRRITLVKTSGIRKSPPQRWELPPWGRNWEIRFLDGNRNVPVT